MVLVEKLSGVVDIAVVPECYDAACQVVAAHRLIVDAGVEERNEVGIVVEVVGIVKTAETESIDSEKWLFDYKLQEYKDSIPNLSSQKKYIIKCIKDYLENYK